MSAADILSDPNFPHGTAEGFRRGCKVIHCPAGMSCHDFHYRYNGDYAFRRAIESGLTPQQVLEAERRPVAPAGRSPEARARANETRRCSRSADRVVKVPRTPTTAYQKQVYDLIVNDKKTDRETGDAVGRTREQIAAVRKYLRLSINLAPRTPAPAGVSSSRRDA